MDNIGYIERLEANGMESLKAAQETLREYAEYKDSIRLYKLAEDLNEVEMLVDIACKLGYTSETIDMAFVKKTIAYNKVCEKKMAEETVLGDFALFNKAVNADFFVNVLIALYEENDNFFAEIVDMDEKRKAEAKAKREAKKAE